MKNLINEQLCIWLKQYARQATDKTIQKTALELIDTIPSAVSLIELIQLFKPYTQLENSYGPIYFYSTLLDWQKLLEERLKSQKAAIARVQEIDSQPKIARLLLMLKELLEEPLILLNVQVPHLLKLINHEHFTALIDFLAQQKIERPQYSSSTTEFAKNRIFGEQVLEVLTKKTEENNSNWHQAYNLIQTALSFYNEDMHFLEIDLGYEELLTEVESPQKEDKCVIL